MTGAAIDRIEPNGGGRTALIGWIVLVATVLAGFGQLAVAGEEVGGSADRIERLIEQLGDDDYLVRQRAHDQLAEFGFEACDALAEAATHEDLEIASRAKYLLGMMQVEWTVGSDPREVKEILADFGRLPMEERAEKIRGLAALPDGMGVVALCRVARFEKSAALSQLAALEILKLEPFPEDLRRERAELLRQNLMPARRTAVKWVLTHVDLRLNPESPLSEWRELVKAELAAVRGNATLWRSRTAVWLLYHQAVLEAGRGDRESADETASAARQVGSGKRPDLFDVRLDVANTLQRWGYFEWAEAEFRVVIDAAGFSDPWFRAVFGLSQMKHDGGEHAAAGAVLQAALDFLKAQAEARALGDISSIDGMLRGRMNYYLSCHWAEQGNSEKEREHVDLALKADPAEIDALIARHRLADVDEEYQRETKRMVDVAAGGLRRTIQDRPDDATYYNQWAWLVGNTDGDLNEALEFSQTALSKSPNNGAYLDTLAHVYFARKEYEKAVKTQEEAVRFEPHSGLIREKLEEFRAKLEEERKKDGGEE